MCSYIPIDRDTATCDKVMLDTVYLHIPIAKNTLSPESRKEEMS